MTREEKINIAASKYIEDNSVRGAVCISNHKDSFIEGADWADEHPKEGLIDLSQVWHDVKEEPEKDKLLIGIDEDDVSIYKWVGQDTDWLSFAKWFRLTEWAYINDLLPKNVGDKSSY